jgi:hypothetical protein
MMTCPERATELGVPFLQATPWSVALSERARRAPKPRANYPALLEERGTEPKTGN